MSNNTIRIPNMLLIAGQQQNVGKTTLACNIISKFSREYPAIALKITPHFHKNTGEAKVHIEADGYSIMEEKSDETNKDTSLMLKSGAEKAYLIQSEPEKLHKAITECLKLIPEKHILVCESAGVREYIEPGVFLALRQLYCKICSIDDDKMFKQADRIITFTVNGFDFSLDELSFEDGKWKVSGNSMDN